MNLFVLYIHFAGLVANTLAWLRRQVWKLRSDAPPRPGDPSLSSTWLAQVLKNNGFKEFTIDSVTVGDLDNNRGLAAQINKIRVAYRDSPSSTPKPPTQFIIKTTTAGYSGRCAVIMQGGYREAWFYQAKNFASFSSVTPRVFYAHGSALFGEAVVLQEDLTTRDSIPMNFIFGNQIWGIPKPIEPHDPVAALQSLFGTAAKRHAAFWNDKSVLECKWLKAASWYENRGRTRWEASMDTTKRRWASAKAKLAALGDQFKLSEELASIIDESLAHSSWEALQAHIKDPKIPFTLCHGDFHASNMFLVRDPVSKQEAPVWFDWSEVGPWEPTTDLAQMIISDTKVDLFTAHSKAMVRHYWDILISHGISDKEYPWEHCWQSFCRGGAERWIWMLCALLDFPLPPVALQYFHDQVLHFIKVHCPGQRYFVLKTLVHLL